MSLTDLRTFVWGLPKAELHVHQIGSASPRIVAELAARSSATPVPADPEMLAGYFAFTDFAHFIEVYLSVVDLVRTTEDVRMLTYEVARDMHSQQIRYAELTCTPYTSVVRGIRAEAFCEAIEDARAAAERDFGLMLRWCFDIPGELGLPAAAATARIACELQPAGLVSLGLGGPEIGVPRAQFKPYFEQARAIGLHSAPHAGETTGPETIWAAIDELGAERIGHGTSATSDPRLVERLVSSGIALEVCPTSNVATGAVTRLADHPVKGMHSAGIVVTVNSDDPPMFGTTLNQEYTVVAELLGLDETGVAALARNAVRAAFTEDGFKQQLLDEIDNYLIRSS